MNEYYATRGNQEWDDIYQSIYCLIEKNAGTWQSVCAVTGLVGGLLSPVLGTILTAVTWFIPTDGASSFLNVLSIALFCLTLPLLAFGAHCLDLLEKIPSILPVITKPKSVGFGDWNNLRPQLPHRN